METTETTVGNVGGAPTEKSPKRKWKRVEVKYSFPDTYPVFADGKCVAVIYFKPKEVTRYRPDAQKPIIQVIRDNVQDVEIRGDGKVVRIMTVEEAEPYARAECPYCMANMAFARKNGWRVIVDMKNKDVIGVEVPPENQGGN